MVVYNGLFSVLPDPDIPERGLACKFQTVGEDSDATLVGHHVAGRALQSWTVFLKQLEIELKTGCSQIDAEIKAACGSSGALCSLLEKL